MLWLQGLTISEYLASRDAWPEPYTLSRSASLRLCRCSSLEDETTVFPKVPSCAPVTVKGLKFFKISGTLIRLHR